MVHSRARSLCMRCAGVGGELGVNGAQSEGFKATRNFTLLGLLPVLATSRYRHRQITQKGGETFPSAGNNNRKKLGA